MSALDPVEQSSLVEFLLAKPARVEPGLLLQDLAIPLRSGAEIGLHGIDLLGRPCLFGMFEQMGPSAYDWALEVITSFREGLEGADPIYRRGREPRLILLSRSWCVEDFARLRFFAQTTAVRGYQIHGDVLDWKLELCFPSAEPSPADAWVEDLGAHDRRFLQRMLAAAGRGGRKVKLQGGLWPLTLVNSEGPFASLHQGESGLLMSVPDGEERFRVLDLNRALDRDLAIDSVLRHRKVSLESE